MGEVIMRQSYLHCFRFELLVFIMALLASCGAYELNLTSETHTSFLKNRTDTGWSSGTKILSPSEIDTAKGKNIKLKKCVLEGNYLTINYSTLYREGDLIEFSFPMLTKGVILNSIYQVDSTEKIGSGDTVVVARRLLDSIPSTMDVEVLGDTLLLSFYLVELGFDRVFLNTKMPFTEVLSIIDFYVNKKCPSDPNNCVRQMIDKYQLLLVKQKSDAIRGMIAKPKGKKTVIERVVPATVNGRLLSGRSSQCAAQILVPRNTGSFNKK